MKLAGQLDKRNFQKIFVKSFQNFLNFTTSFLIDLLKIVQASGGPDSGKSHYSIYNNSYFFLHNAQKM